MVLPCDRCVCSRVFFKHNIECRALAHFNDELFVLEFPKAGKLDGDPIRARQAGQSHTNHYLLSVTLESSRERIVPHSHALTETVGSGSHRRAR